MTYMISNRLLRPLSFVLLSLVLAAGARAETQMLDRIVAIVGDDVVMESELEERFSTVKERLSENANRPAPPDQVLREQILDQLVLERMQLQMGKRYGIEISEEQLDNAVQRVIENNGMTEAELRESLAQSGETMEEFRAKIHKDMWLSQIQQAVVNNRIDINEQDIDSFLASTEGKYATAPNYRLGHILIPVASGSSSEDVEATGEQARELYRELVDGASFEQMAITHSKDANALEGGELGWRKLEQLPELFADEVADMEEGDISEPIRSGAGFHILKVHETRTQDQDSGIVEQTKARHILIEPSELVNDRAARDKLSELRQRALDGEDFSELAREHSEDINSRLQGGDLGWTMPGQMVPAFDQTMQRTEVGEVSKPFESEYGWHILTVEDRREQDMSDRVLRNRAANMLRERRFDEELQTWQAEIREEIYVEKKL